MVGKYHQFKDGDFIVPVKRQSLIFIYREHALRFKFDYCLRSNSALLSPYDFTEDINALEIDFRSATPYEIQAMLSALLKKGLYWDFLRKSAIDLDNVPELFYR